MCNDCTPTNAIETSEGQNSLVRFSPSNDGTRTHILIDSDEHGTVVSATVKTEELFELLRVRLNR